MKLIKSYMAETVQPFRQHMQQEHFTKLNNTLFYDLFPLFVRQKDAFSVIHFTAIIAKIF